MGYDPHFLGGDPVPLPTLSMRLAEQAHADGRPIDHERFSVIFHADRGLAICTAHTIDGATLLPEGLIRRNDRFRFDDQVPNDLQIDDRRGYWRNPWDRGHLTRRRSLHWGSEQDARTADGDSYFWTNIAPQHEHLHDTAWGAIEDWMLDLAETGSRRAAVFTGPVMMPDDPLHQNAADEEPIQIPAGFWKIIVIPHGSGRTIATFLVWQRDHDSEDPVAFSPFLEQVRLTTVEFLTGLSFVELRELDPLRFGATRAPTRSGRRGGVPAAAPVMRSNAVLSPADIVL